MSAKQLLKFTKSIKAIAFDLDGTLIHSMVNINNYNLNKFRKYDFSFRLDNDEYYTWIRPHTQLILPQLSEHFKLYVFTKASRRYADQVILQLFGKTDIFSGRFYRDSFFVHESKNVKLITSEKIVLVDDNLTNRSGEDNEIFYHIPPYNFFSEKDSELAEFLFYLKEK